MSLKTVSPIAGYIFVLTVGLGAIVAITMMAMRSDMRSDAVQAHPMRKVQREDDPERGVACYWVYTGSGGGVALSCVVLAADAGPR